MRIGVDFDNTIVCYDQLFHRIALERGLIPASLPATKGHVRDMLRRMGREEEWTEMQGQVYGKRLHEAEPFAGVLEFFTLCRERGWIAFIISHRTRYPFVGEQYDLHDAAQRWLTSHGFYDPVRIGLSAGQVHFELSKQAKLDRIASVGCDYFIDDLPEFLLEPGFPAGVKRILFDPNGAAGDELHRATSWRAIEAVLAQ